MHRGNLRQQKVHLWKKLLRVREKEGRGGVERVGRKVGLMKEGDGGISRREREERGKEEGERNTQKISV